MTSTGSYAPANEQLVVEVMVPNVDEYWALAKQMGARIFKEIGDQYYGRRDLTLVGRDGIAIRFATLLSEH